ncbi:MAG: hypothetical protein ACWGMZ_07185 [Thermoguttaceae bacterium]
MSEGKSRKMPTLLFDAYIFVMTIPLLVLLYRHIRLIHEFGFINMAANIEANPNVFMKEFAPGIVKQGWIAVGVLAAVVVISLINWIHRWFSKPCQTEHDKP